MGVESKILLVKTLKLSWFCIIIVSVAEPSFSQNYNINVLPARVIYNSDKEYFTNKPYGFQLYLLYKYAEIERKINDKMSINFGVVYSKNYEKVFLGSYRSIFYGLEPSVRYYLNKKNNMSGFYFGSGLTYYRFSDINKGRFASDDGSILENDIYRNYLSFNLYSGYKICLFKSRFSIDFKLITETTVYNRNFSKAIYSDFSVKENRFSYPSGKIEYPYLDLKLGYRFGFKK